MNGCIKMNYFVIPVCILMLLTLMAGCAPIHRPPTMPLPEQPTAIPPVSSETPEVTETVDPRHRASLQLTAQARILLEQERYDDAIRTLERALGLYPRNGQSYYYMAEAWLEKRNIQQAAEYNRLAEMYLDDPEWDERIHKQQQEIESGNSGPE